MTKKVLLTFLVIWLFSNTGSAQILKNTWIINPQLSGFNLGSTHTEDTGKETFDLGLKSKQVISLPIIWLFLSGSAVTSHGIKSTKTIASI